MSVPIRAFNFASLAGQPIYGSNINVEFDKIYNALSGLSSDTRIVINFSGSDATLKINQNGSGDIFKGQVDGVDALTINNSGQIVSTVLTGTAPIEVSSTTKVVNLNADKVNGIEGSQLIRNDQSGQALLGNLRLKKLSTGTYDAQFEMDNDSLTFYRYNDSNNIRAKIFSIDNINDSNRLIQLDSNFRLQLGYDPTEDNDVARKIDLINRLTVLTIPGLISAPSSTSRACFFVPNAECIITSIKFGYLTGTPTTDLTLTFNYSSTQSFTLVSGATAENVYTHSLTPVTLEPSNKCWISTSSSATGHTNIFVELIGYYTGN